jgi:hypothetical protein
MNYGLCSLLAVAAAGSALVAGCGSSSSTPASASSSSSSSAPAATSTASSASSSSSTSAGSGLASNPTVIAAVARCKASINAAPTLSASAKSKLATICDEAAKGDPASLKKAEAQVCVELVKDTVPAAAQTQALASCPKA